MGHPHNLTCTFFSLLFLMIPSMTQHGSMAQGRAQVKNVDHDFDFSKVKAGPINGGDGKMVLRARIGSRPPRCERRCSWCGGVGHCEAIQVPTTTSPQEQQHGKGTSPSTVSNDVVVVDVVVVHERGDDDASNYKPMSWKCKCGSFIFNP